MTTTLDEARQLATELLEPEWQGPGTFYVAPWAWQDSRYYSLAVGAREWLEGGSLLYQVLDDRAVLVDKMSGELTTPSMMGPLAMRVAMMHPCGEPEPALPDE